MISPPLAFFPPLCNASFCGYLRLEEAPAHGLKAKRSPSQTASSESLRVSFASRAARASTKSSPTSRGYTRRRPSARSRKKYRQVTFFFVLAVVAVLWREDIRARCHNFCADRCCCVWECVLFFTHNRSRMTIWCRPSRVYNAGTEHVGFSLTSETPRAPSAKRREVFGESFGR